MSVKFTGRRRRTRSRRLVAGLVLVLSVIVSGLAGSMTSASAHSDLVTSSPSDGTKLASPPARVELVFSDEVLPKFATIALTVGDAAPVVLDAAIDGSRISAPIPDVPDEPSPGQAARPWVVNYRIVSGDGHPIDGTVRWTVKAPRGRATKPGADAPEAAPDAGSTDVDAAPSSVEQADGWSSWWALALVVPIAVGGLLVARGKRLPQSEVGEGGERGERG